MARLPPFMALRALEAAARLRSYSRAAEELHVTHGAVSHQIRRLEEEFGLRLFRREGNAMIPTEPALKLAAKVAAALRLLETGATELASERGARTLVISSLRSFAGRWLAPRLQRFTAGETDLEIEIRGEERLADFVYDGVDVAVRYGAGDWSEVEVEPLFGERLFPVCSADFLARHPLRQIEDLASAPLLRQRNRAWTLWFKSVGLGFAEPNTGMVFDDSSLLLDAAAQGLGVALARESLAEDDLRSGRLVQPFPHAVGADYGYYLVWRADSPKLPAIRRFRDWIRGEVAAMRQAAA
jgi:LysR family glycine cleavage system transcriptional activator